MIGQRDFRYELYGLGQDQLLNLMMIDKQHLQPNDVLQQDNYVFYEYDATTYVKLDFLLQSLPFIALSLKQLLLILKGICEKLKKIQAKKLSIQEISLKNIIIFVDNQFCYYKTASVIKNFEFIGLQYVNTQADQFKWFIQTKRLILSILNLYEKNNIKLPRCASIQQEWNEFFKNINTCENYEQFIDQFLKEKLSDPSQVKFQFEGEIKLWSKYDYLQNEIFEQFKEFLYSQIIQFEEGLELKPQQLKKIIISSLSNQSYIVLYKSIDDYLQTKTSYIYNYQIDKQFLSEISNLFDETFKMIKKGYNFNSLFQQQYDDNQALQDHFKRYYIIPQNWFEKLGLKNLMPDFLMITAKAGYLNCYQNLYSTLKYLEQYPSDQQETIQLDNNPNPLSPKIFEQFLIQKLQDYHCMVVESLFEQKEQKLIQDIPITNK